MLFLLTITTNILESNGNRVGYISIMTIQFPEKLIYKGDTLSMYSEPLKFWLNAAGKDITFGGPCSSACKRRYIGEWQVINDHLYLININAEFANGEPMKIDNLFPGFPKGVFAHWFSSEVRCPQGEILYVRSGASIEYERDLYLTFSKGLLVSEKMVVNELEEDKDPAE